MLARSLLAAEGSKQNFANIDVAPWMWAGLLGLLALLLLVDLFVFHREAHEIGTKEAAIEYRRALGLCPGFIDIRMRLAHALADHGALAEAIEQVRLVLLDSDGYIPAHLHLGLLLHRAGDDAGARKALNEVLRREPGHERAAMYLRMLEPGVRSA